jgi:hypothetical protein
MNSQEKLAGINVESYIEEARRQMCLAPTVEEQRRWWARMLYWHKQRTDRQVHALEISRGLTHP